MQTICDSIKNMTLEQKAAQLVQIPYVDNSQGNRHKKEKESRQKSRWNVAECITTDVHQLLCKAKNFCSN